MKNKKLKPNRNNIETFLPLFNGFYGSFWDEPDFYGEAEHYGLPEDFDFYEHLNWAEYKNALCVKITNKVEELLSDYVEKIEFQHLNSPQYYNFKNDSIYCIIRPKKQAIIDYINANRPQLSEYLERKFKSRDGFISFYSYSIEVWEQEYTNWWKNWSGKGIYLGTILDFILENEKTEYSELYFATEGVYASEYLNESFNDIVNGKRLEIKPFIQENYTRYSNDELIEQVRAKYEDEDTLNIILDTAKECIKEIESTNYQLKL